MQVSTASTNLPASLLDDVLAFVSGVGHDRVAVAVDARSAALASLTEQVGALKARGIDCRLLFLEATVPTLLRRYSETRRRHPLAGAGPDAGRGDRAGAHRPCGRRGPRPSHRHERAAAKSAARMDSATCSASPAEA
jgi:hypothetical protein